MAQDKKISEGRLLYDPLFDAAEQALNNPQGVKNNSFARKLIFVVVLAVCIGVSLFLSFNSLTKDKYQFENTDAGYIFSEFNGGKTDVCLNIEYVTDKDGVVQGNTPVTAVRTFAVCCNEYLEYIYIGKDITAIDFTSFYTCTALRAVYVSPENEHYASRDGVLYKKENGTLTELVLYPVKNGSYRTAQSLGLSMPENPDDIYEYRDTLEKNKDRLEKAFDAVGKSYVIEPTVTVIGGLSFSGCSDIEKVTIPDGVKEIGTLAFLGCSNLNEPNLPDGLERIGSDAFTKCVRLGKVYIPKSVKEIDHNAFWIIKNGDVPDEQQPTISFELSEESAKSDIKFGTSWHQKNVAVLYGQTREEAAK
ncbi:MAG: leucine-rich repeat domain-containing protein [Clostridiales bacterium]|nr:leucine-rich repeat domain-containing protein [Clostridiales bacterium]